MPQRDRSTKTGDWVPGYNIAATNFAADHPRQDKPMPNSDRTTKFSIISLPTLFGAIGKFQNSGAILARAATAVLLCSIYASPQARTLHSYAIIQDDASLLVEGQRIHLYGLYLPPTSRYCRRNIRPVRCGNRAVLALQFKIQGFVHCYPQTQNADGSFNGICYQGRSSFDDGEDLGGYLIDQGWALALPNAPFEYHARERIARHRGAGVWGFTVDSFRRD